MKKIHEDLYHQDYYFFPGDSEETYETYIRKSSPNYSVNLVGVHGNTTRDANGIYIWLRANDDLGVLMHECIHAASYTLSDRGIKADIINDEPIAYLAQWIFDKCKVHMKGYKR